MPEVVAGSAAYPPDGPGPVVTIGNFDGVHFGHRALLRRLVAAARQRDTAAVVYTFEPSPRTVLSPHQAMPRILAWPDKVRLLGQVGVDRVVVERFTPAFAQHPPDWFAKEVLKRRLRAQSLVVGYDFRFGRARGGDVPLLRKLLPSLEIEQVDAAQIDAVVASSSAVRRRVAEGRVSDAARLLGRAHFVRGTVVAGDRRGRMIGFPTANVQTDAELLPAQGVYAVWARVDGGAAVPGVANLGMRPTFDGTDCQLEVHLLDRGEDLYGRELQVDFVAHLRDECRFDGVDSLVAQIREDASQARRILSTAAPI
ncbi:MAG: bifunctional riboflavin kinase/FAD synthetase [Oligoflexia bacterium]|nr:bifunctional riboflavin kinase/FAD synthetase [Oligoflexia bacterium]